MDNKKIAIFQIDGWQSDYIQKQLEKNGFNVDMFKSGIDIAEVSNAEDYSAISVFIGPKIDENVLDKFSNIKLITTRSTGFDHIDIKLATDKKISLGYVPHYGENTVAEYAVGLILTLSRKLYLGIDRIKEDRNFDFHGLEGVDLMGKTIGVIGTGRIGAKVIEMIKGFNMKVVGYDAYPNKDLSEKLGFEYMPLKELLGISDFITLHVPYMPETHHLINMDNIDNIKMGAYLINTSRGPVVETDALVLALEKKILAGAGLDVLEEEDIEKDEMGFWLKNLKKTNDGKEDTNLKIVLENNILMKMSNVVITPHNAFNTKEAKTRILNADIKNITSFFETGSVEYKIPNK